MDMFSRISLAIEISMASDIPLNLSTSLSCEGHSKSFILFEVLTNNNYCIHWPAWIPYEISEQIEMYKQYGTYHRKGNVN